MRGTISAITGILVPLVALLIFGYVSYQYTTETGVDESWANHTILVLQKIEHLFLILKDSQSAQQEYLLSGNESYLTPYTTTLSEYKMDLAELRQLTSDNPVEQENLNKLEPLIKDGLAHEGYVIDVRRNQDAETAEMKINNDTGQANMEEIRKIVTNMTDEENSLLVIRNNALHASTTFTDNLLVYGTAIVAITTTSIIVFTILQLKKRQSLIKKELDKQVEEKTIQLQQTNKIIESQKQELVAANEELKNKDKYKSEFVAMISHELRTPLVPIQGYVDILLAEHLGSLNKEQKERLEITKSNIATLLRMIGDLLDAQKLELGQLKFDKKIHNLSELINEAILNLKEIADKHGVTITKELSDVSLFCDKERMEQVLTNLVLNSIDFVPKKDGKITIKLYEKDNHAIIIVKDNGIGIGKDDLEKVFMKFYQIDTSTTRERGGTGLGLSICKGIVENHGGKIWVESDGPGTGTEFHISLPKTIG